MSHAQCEFLCQHIDTVRPITHVGNDDRTRHVMLRQGFIRNEPANAITPIGTVLTEDGRAMVCAICDMWLEALLAAQTLRSDRVHDQLLHELKKHYAERFNA